LGRQSAGFRLDHVRVEESAETRDTVDDAEDARGSWGSKRNGAKSREPPESTGDKHLQGRAPVTIGKTDQRERKMGERRARTRQRTRTRAGVEGRRPWRRGRSSEREGLAAGQSLATNGEDRGVDGELQVAACTDPTPFSSEKWTRQTLSFEPHNQINE
jgi:hypothetical protein